MSHIPEDFPRRAPGNVAGRMNLAEATVSHRTLSPVEQVAWVELVRATVLQAPLIRPRTPNGLAMRVRVSAAGALGWVGDGEYRYDPHQLSGKPWPPIPARWTTLADQVAGVHPWDSAIVNWYDAEASLGWHRDKSEADTSLPIVTVSLGDTASWAVRDHDGRASRVRIDSGAVTMLAGPYRNLEHSVERIIHSPLLSPLDVPGRISVTLRVAGRPV